MTASPPVIPDSARLRFCLMDGRSARDRELWFEMEQDREAMRFLNEGKATTREQFESLVAPRFISFTDPAQCHGLWGLSEKATDEFLGWILVRHFRFDRADREPDNIELGWRVKRSHWNQGIASEAARALIAVLQQNPAVRVFSAMADPANLASTGVMKKLGMHFVDDRVHVVGDRRFPAAYYELLSPGYRA
jgi:RimJ/RimL family protein N-acetyltransferase